MMLFQRRIFSELVRNTLSTILVLVVIVVLVISVRVVHKVEGLDWGIFLRLLPLMAASHLDILLPVAVLVSVVLTYGRLAADNEADTLRASGVHLAHIYVPGLVFGFLTSVLLLWVMDDVRPWADRAQKRLSNEANIALLLRRQLESGELVNVSDDLVVSVDSFDETGRAQDLRIQFFDSETDELEREIIGEADLSIDKATDELVVDLYDYKTIKGPRFEGSHTTIRHPLPKALYRLDIGQMATHQLLAYLGRPAYYRQGFKEQSVHIEVYMRLAVAAACVLFVLLGIPVALLFRSNDRVTGFLVAFLLALFLYYPSLKISLALAEETAVPVPVATWAGNGFLLLAGVGLSLKALRR